MAVLLTLAFYSYRWRGLVFDDYPSTPAPTALERRYGPAYDARDVALLRRKLPPDFQVKGTLAEAVDQLRPQAEPIELFVNWRALEGAGIRKETPVSITLGNVSIDDALTRLMTAAGGARLGFVLDDKTFAIDTLDNLPAGILTRVYDARDLLPGARSPEYRAAVTALAERIQREVDPASWNGVNKELSGDPVTARPASIRTLQGQMIVTQTAVNQREVKRLFERLRWYQSLRVFAHLVGPPVGVAVAAALAQQIAVTLYRRRALRGRCRTCGYDLRATPERCPESGTVASRSASAAAPVTVAAGSGSIE